MQVSNNRIPQVKPPVVYTLTVSEREYDLLLQVVDNVIFQTMKTLGFEATEVIDMSNTFIRNRKH